MSNIRKVILPAILLTGSLAVGSLGFKVARADEAYAPIVQRIAERFDISVDEVQEVFDEYHDEKHTDMMARWEERLNDLVQQGKITEIQKEAVISKQVEIKEKIDTLRDLQPEERRVEMSKIHEEFRTWASENGLGFGNMELGRGFREGLGAGHMMMRAQ